MTHKIDIRHLDDEDYTPTPAEIFASLFTFNPECNDCTNNEDTIEQLVATAHQQQTEKF